MRDIVLKGTAEEMDSATNIGSIMSGSVVSVAPNTDIHEAARIMEDNKTRRLSVVENNTVVGVVSMGDLAVGYDF